MMGEAEKYIRGKIAKENIKKAFPGVKMHFRYIDNNLCVSLDDSRFASIDAIVKTSKGCTERE